jgi:cellobiose-specific phosphotransferase system component IIC
LAIFSGTFTANSAVLFGAKATPEIKVAKLTILNVIIGINGFVWNGTLAIAGLIFAFSWGYNLATNLPHKLRQTLGEDLE